MDYFNEKFGKPAGSQAGGNGTVQRTSNKEK